jgi:serine/threonine protein kinase HipA of HipAB toxin-antitoxin module
MGPVVGWRLPSGGAWYRPHGATPTTHILKLPLGIVGNFRGDFADSVENEWLCVQLMREFGLPIADLLTRRRDKGHRLMFDRCGPFSCCISAMARFWVECP